MISNGLSAGALRMPDTSEVAGFLPASVLTFQVYRLCPVDQTKFLFILQYIITYYTEANVSRKVLK